MVGANLRVRPATFVRDIFAQYSRRYQWYLRSNQGQTHRSAPTDTKTINTNNHYSNKNIIISAAILGQELA
jgi:hypothetical protein